MIDASFYNQSKQNMQIEDVVEHMKAFIKKDPTATYRISIGTDSHVHQRYTRFITAIHIHRVGKGAWGCIRNHTINRQITSLKEKISKETILSQEVAFPFISLYLEQLAEIILPYEEEGGNLQFEIHLDIGKRGLTKNLIQDMTNRIDAMGVDVKIKPDSYAASSYAHKYTK